MMAALRSYFASALALLIVVTSQQLAIARGQPHAMGQVEICSGDGIIVMTLDADGNPVGPAHICPDAALNLITGFTFESPEITPVIHMRRAVYLAEFADQNSVIHTISSARDPPDLI